MIHDKKQAESFHHWLKQNGLEDQPVTSPHEVFRFRYTLGVFVLYAGKRGYAFNCADMMTAYRAFAAGKPCPFKPGSRARKNGRGSKWMLQVRDGLLCFYCGLHMEDADISEEHVLSLIHGGSNRLENKVLAHKACNGTANNNAVIDKIRLRDRLRAQNGVGTTVKLQSE